MPRPPFIPVRRIGPLWMVLTAWEVYKRLPKPVRRRLVREVSKHGPAAARAARRTAERAFAERRRREP